MRGEWDEFAADDFAPKDYVERLTHSLVAQARRDTQKFDPAPLVKVLENNIEHLAKVRKSVQRKVGELEDAVQAAETSHRIRVRDLEPVFEETGETFEKLESRMGEVGSTAVLIGEQLESLDRQRVRANDAKNLVLHFMEFNSGHHATIDAIKSSGGWDGKSKAAEIVKRLSTIAREVDLPAAETARQGIERYGEAIERELLGDFERGFKEKDIEALKTCARILMDFNGGHSCVQAYVNQHDFFTKNSAPTSATQTEQIGGAKFRLVNDLAEYEKEPRSLDIGLGRLFDNIVKTVAAEWSTVQAVFPNALAVLQMFVQRIFAQTVQAHIEHLLSQAADTSLLMFLQVLTTTHAATRECTDMLAKFVDEKLQHSEPTSVAAFKASLARSRDDLFVAYTDNDKYIEKEMQSIAHINALAIAHFNDFRSARKNALKNKSYFTKLQVAAANPQGILSSEPSYLALPDEMGLSVESIVRLLDILKTAVDRTSQLNSPNDSARYAHMIFASFLEAIGRRFVEACLELVLEDLSAAEPKTEPDLRYMAVIQTVNGIVHAIQRFFQTSIAPLISVQPTTHRETLIRKNDFVTALETKINVVLQKLITAVNVWLSVALARQRKNDFRPKDGEHSGLATSAATAPCSQCCEYLSKLYAQLVTTLDGRNLEVVLGEVGVQFHGLLLEHVKKFTINTSGGILLTKDLAKYQETVTAWKLPAVTDRFEALRQLGNVYLVPPENLKSLLEEGSLSRIDPSILHAFVTNRSDYKQANLNVLFHGEVVDDQEQQRSAWENLESAFDAMNDTFGEVGDTIQDSIKDSIKKMAMMVV